MPHSFCCKRPIVETMVLRACLLFSCSAGPSCWGSTLLAVKFKLNLILKSLISQLLQRIWCWIFQFKQEIVIWKQCSKFIMPFALQTKFDYIAHKIAEDCTLLCSARFTTTTHKTDSSLSLVLFMNQYFRVPIASTTFQNSFNGVSDYWHITPNPLLC